jgi:hypothetical protein
LLGESAPFHLCLLIKMEAVCQILIVEITTNPNSLNDFSCLLRSSLISVL